ncbi:hypothetical protein ACFP3Q_05915 [Nocardioides sp. GCM10027113]|uniref:hypothetical protein n=1 Tax=unclassified Nocardioides TaxID=2615069 RepID=UPI0036146249
MSRRGSALTLLTSAALLVAAALVATPGASGDAPDNRPPVVVVDPEFEVGAQVRRWLGYVCEGHEVTEVPYLVRYSATDESGIRWYNRWNLDGDSEPEGPSDFWGDFDRLPWHDTLTDYGGECGGRIPEQSGWAVTAYDQADNAKYATSGPAQPEVYQQDGVSVELDAEAIPVDRTGRWRTSTCRCASGGTQMHTWGRGATATYWIEVASARGAHLGLVMPQGPKRGRFQVLVDGDVVATLDSLATRNRNRVVVWHGVVEQGDHTLAVRNLRTSGRGRIDVDAVLVYERRQYVS